jgi:ubiquinone/menaquinone biosynthesis C-methylase UbiE
MPIFTENGGITHLAWQEGRWRLLSHNENAHLVETSGLALLPWAEADQLKTIVDHFDHMANTVSLQLSPATESSLRDLVALATPRREDHVIDAGTGAGTLALAFSPAVASVTAVDVSPGMLERAEIARQAAETTNIEIRWADATNLSPAIGVVDIIACRDLIHYVDNLAGLFSNWHRVLVSGEGKLVLDEVIGSEDELKRATQQAIEMERDPAITRLHSESEVERQMRAADFRIERATAYDISVSMEEWLAGAACDEEARASVAEMMRSSIEEDATGLRIRREINGDIRFVQRRLRLLARAA